MQLWRPLRARSRLGARHAREDVDFAKVAAGELAGDGAVGMIGGEGLGRGSRDPSPPVSPGAGLRGPCIKDRWGVRQSRGPYVSFFRGVHCARSIAPSRRVFYGARACVMAALRASCGHPRLLPVSPWCPPVSPRVPTQLPRWWWRSRPATGRNPVWRPWVTLSLAGRCERGLAGGARRSIRTFARRSIQANPRHVCSRWPPRRRRWPEGRRRGPSSGAAASAP